MDETTQGKHKKIKRGKIKDHFADLKSTTRVSNLRTQVIWMLC